MSTLKDVRQDAVTLFLGGRERSLVYDLNAFAELEKRYGSVEAAMDQLQEGGMTGIRTILWAGLIHDEAVIDQKTGEPTHYTISPYNVGGWITPSMLADISGKLMEALGSVMTPEEVDEEAKVKLAEAGYKMGDNGLVPIIETKEEIAEKND